MDYDNVVQAAVFCPFGWQRFDEKTCAVNERPVARPDTNCGRVLTVGNPVAVISGCKVETVELHALKAGSFDLPIALTYASIYGLYGGRSVGLASWFLDPIDRRIDLASLALDPPRLVAVRAHGQYEEFEKQSNGSWVSFDNQIKLEQGPDGGWIRRDFREQVVERYDNSGRLSSLRAFQGGGVDLAYADSAAKSAFRITSTTGRQVDLRYDPSKYVKGLVLPDGSTIQLGYELTTELHVTMSGTILKSVTFQDGRVRTFNYAPAAVGNFGTSYYRVGDLLSGSGVRYDGNPSPQQDVLNPQFALLGRAVAELTSITDESGAVYSAYKYNSGGQTTESSHSGGAYRFAFEYSSSATTVTEPLGGVTEYRFATVADQVVPVEIVRRGSNFLETTALQYDDKRRMIRQTGPGSDRQACMEYDPATNRVAVRLEGRLPSAGCPVGLSAYVPPNEPGSIERKITYRWDPVWRLLTSVAQPNRVTTYFYNGIAVNGSIVSCAPPAALVFGSAMPLLCATEERATADNTGAQGFAAATVGLPRRTTYTYNEQGQILSVDGFRTDVSDSRRYTYYKSSSADYSMGDLESIVNEQGHVTKFTKYDRNGRALSLTDPNGTVFNLEYWPRGLVKSVSAASGGVSRVTRFAYTPYGKLARLTEATGAYVDLSYDAAQRLTGATDNLGNKIEFSLDAAGNVRDEQYKSPSGQLTRRVSRIFSDLNRLQAITGALQ